MSDELLAALQKHIDETIGKECIDGVDPESLVKDVILEIAAVPMCVECMCIGDDWQYRIPPTVRYEQWKNPPRWAIVKPAEHDFTIVTEKALKVMRARFLLLNGWYYRNFHTLSYPTQQEVAQRFLQHTQGMPPKPGSPMAKMLDIKGSDEEPTS